jgi:hypothetical protein
LPRTQLAESTAGRDASIDEHPLAAGRFLDCNCAKALRQPDGGPRFGHASQRLDCLARHVRFEPANPPASYLIGIAWQLRLRAAQLRRRRPFACELRDTDFAALVKISAVDL